MLWIHEQTKMDNVIILIREENYIYVLWFESNFLLGIGILMIIGGSNTHLSNRTLSNSKAVTFEYIFLVLSVLKRKEESIEHENLYSLEDRRIKSYLANVE